MVKLIRLMSSKSVESLVVFGASPIFVIHLQLSSFLFRQVFWGQKCYMNPLKMMDHPLNIMEVFSQLTNEALVHPFSSPLILSICQIYIIDE